MLIDLDVEKLGSIAKMLAHCTILAHTTNAPYEYADCIRFTSHFCCATLRALGNAKYDAKQLESVRGYLESFPNIG